MPKPNAPSFADELFSGVRAAQYVRMSTDLQKYSIQNQADAIAAYAARHGIAIVHSYEDAGRSGLRLNGRQGLKDLIADIRSGNADFDRVLVYDVSRWGRFQDTDESAYYEYICKQAGTKVEYCAEQFENDGSMMSSILKALKRVMAAEYSRELSAKVFAGQCRLAALGYWHGGPASYGLRRQLIDEHGQPRQLLKYQERKYLLTDHVILRPGPIAEQRVIRSVFRQYVGEHKSELEIARALNSIGSTTQYGRPWTRRVIRTILTNENYVGMNVYNKTSMKLGQKRTHNPPDKWIRSNFPNFRPVVEPNLFWQAKEAAVTRPRLILSSEELLNRLKLLLEQKGKLSAGIINEAESMPCADCYISRFGNLREAYRLIDYYPTSSLKYNDARRALNSMLSDLAADIAWGVRRARLAVNFDQKTNVLTLNGRRRIWLVGARYFLVKGRWPRWTIARANKEDADLVIVCRMNESNEAPLDYYLLPSIKVTGPKMQLTETSSVDLEQYRIVSRSELVDWVSGYSLHLSQI
jgi:DNA invertase Pin-like site-specific DNA recombinase